MNRSKSQQSRLTDSHPASAVFAVDTRHLIDWRREFHAYPMLVQSMRRLDTLSYTAAHVAQLGHYLSTLLRLLNHRTKMTLLASGAVLHRNIFRPQALDHQGLTFIVTWDAVGQA